ncbi:LysR family transcriptional regulator [Pseudomonas sp. R2.Fl]|nr:LysR family transcriptional regulator [Pseudomonas sp. R2.Fl]
MAPGSKLDTRSLEIFLAVCNTGSMTDAARKLGVTQGAVSQQISRLEDAFNLKLLERGSRGFRLLPAGLNLQHHAQRVLDELRATERSMQQFQGFSFPSLSIRIMDTLGKTLTSTVVETLQGVSEAMQVRGSVTYRHREDLSSGAIDMVISAQTFDPDAFEIHPLLIEPILLLAPKGVVDPQNIDLDALAGLLPFIRYAHRRHLGGLADAYLAHHMINIVRAFEIDQATAVIEMVRHEKGWAITTPCSLLDPLFHTEEIDVLALPSPVPTRSINLVVRPGRFADLPGRLAANCREHLRRDIKSRLSSILPSVSAPLILDA